MKSKQFSSVHLSSLGVSDAYALFRETVEITAPAQNVIGDVAQTIYTRLSADTTAMGAPLKLAQKNALTPDIKMIDNERDKQLDDIKRDIIYFSKGREVAKKEAAARLKIVVEPYWEITHEPFNTETKSIDTLVNRIKSDATLQADAELIGIATKLAELGVTNATFAEAYKTRTTTQGNKVAEASASTLRPAATESYNDFCAALEHAVNYTPNDEAVHLFNAIEQLRTRYNALVATAKKTKDSPAQ